MHFDGQLRVTKNQAALRPVIFLAPHARSRDANAVAARTDRTDYYTISLSIGLPVARPDAAPRIQLRLHEPPQPRLPRVLGNALQRQHGDHS